MLPSLVINSNCINNDQCKYCDYIAQNGEYKENVSWCMGAWDVTSKMIYKMILTFLILSIFLNGDILSWTKNVTIQ